MHSFTRYLMQTPGAFPSLSHFCKTLTAVYCIEYLERTEGATSTPDATQSTTPSLPQTAIAPSATVSHSQPKKKRLSRSKKRTADDSDTARSSSESDSDSESSNEGEGEEDDQDRGAQDRDDGTSTTVKVPQGSAVPTADDVGIL